ncbi:MAG: hypothetical protein V3U49_02770 [Nitrososphaerales archaeon]
MSIDAIRGRIRDQLTLGYLKDVKDGRLGVVKIQEFIPILEDALEKAERSGRRVVIKNMVVESPWSLGADEIQDQIASLRRVLTKI